jgi:hypothetical protein
LNNSHASIGSEHNTSMHIRRRWGSSRIPHLMKFADQVPIVYAASERNGLSGLF